MAFRNIARILGNAGFRASTRLTVLLMCLSGCAFFDNTIIKMPIALHQAGSIEEADFEIKQDDRVTLLLRFFVNSGSDDRKRLLAFLGGFGEVKKIIPINITLTKYTSSKKDIVISEKIYYTSKSIAYGSTELDWIIDDLTIRSGKYRIRLETINDFPNLSSTKVEFGIYYIRPPIM